ncbi:MAG: 30S ribosomal protein S3, partial [Candidatus Bathyarchaeota archaeon]
MSIVRRIIKNNIEFVKVDELLADEYEQAGYGGIQLTKTPMGVQINLFAMRPGRVIGKRGRAIKAASERLETELGLPNPQITVIEVEVPELNPQIMAARIANALERGVHFRRAIFWSLRRIMDSGALGCEILLKGPLRSARSRFEKVVEGYVPKSGEPALRNVKISTLHVKMKRGTLGVTVKIVPPDAKFPDKVSLEGLPDIEYQLPMEEPAPVAEVPAEAAEPVVEETIKAVEPEAEAAEPVITDEAVTEETPVQEETPVEGAAVEPAVEEPVVEGSTPAEPAVDEPTVEGAPEAVEEPAIEEPEASAPEEAIAEESAVEETIEAAVPVITDEAVTEETPVQEETP